MMGIHQCTVLLLMETMNRLKDFGLDINAQNHNELSPVHLAAINRQKDTIKILLDSKIKHSLVMLAKIINQIILKI